MYDDRGWTVDWTQLPKQVSLCHPLAPGYMNFVFAANATASEIVLQLEGATADPEIQIVGSAPTIGDERTAELIRGIRGANLEQSVPSALYSVCWRLFESGLFTEEVALWLSDLVYDDPRLPPHLRSR